MDSRPSDHISLAMCVVICFLPLGFIVPLIPLVKIVFGAVTSGFFENFSVGSWWVGVITMVVLFGVPATLIPRAFSWQMGLRLVLRVVGNGGAIYATYFDSTAANYFNSTIKQCAFTTEDIECYCDATESEFRAIFRFSGYQCDNPFTREPAYLIANAVFSGCCAVILVASLGMLIWSVTSAKPEEGHDTADDRAPSTAV